MRRFLPLAVAISATVLATGCGSSSSDGGSSSSDGGGYGGSGQSAGGGYGDSKPAQSKDRAGAIALRTGPSGAYLVDGRGRSLYLFEADKTRSSTCSGACAQAWPPLAAKSKPTAGKGVRAGLLGTTARADGSSQATYAGHPLYRYAGDRRAVQTSGQGLDDFGAEWYLVKGGGAALED